MAPAGKPVAILLAAGRGRRFDPAGVANKLLQPLAGGAPVVVASARKLLSQFDKVIAVVAPNDGGVADVLRALGCTVTVCPDADSGMAASLVHAIRHSLAQLPLQLPTQLPAPDGWLIALGDMPFVLPSTIAALRDALAAGAADDIIAVPVCGGRRGNPAAFGAAYLPQLLALEGDQGARAIIQAAVVCEIGVDDPGIFSDIDTRADLAKTSTLA